MRGVISIGLMLAVLLGLAGCQRLRVESTVEIARGMHKEVEVDAPRYEQRVKVTIAAEDAPVSAYLVTKDNLEKVKNELDKIDNEPPASMVLASRVSKDKAETYEFEATVPAKTSYSLILRASRKGNAKAKYLIVAK